MLKRDFCRATRGPKVMHERIVIAEDESLLRQIIARHLTRRGLLVEEAGTGAEALTLLRAERPKLLLIDINLPDRSGWDVLRELRDRGIEVPTIVISAVPLRPERIAEFKPLAYLPKPFPLDVLLRLVVGQPAEPEAS